MKGGGRGLGLGGGIGLYTADAVNDVSPGMARWERKSTAKG